MRWASVAIVVAAVAMALVSHVATAAVSRTIAVGPNPFGLAIDASSSRLFVANSGATFISVIDIRSEQVTAAHAVGSGPGRIAHDPETGKVYVSNFNDASVTVLSADGAALATLPVGGLGLAVDRVRDVVYAAGGQTLAVIDTRTDRVLRIVAAPAGASWWGVAVDARGRGKVYVTSLSDSTLYALDPVSFAVTVTRQLSGELRFGLVVDEIADVVYVTRYAADGSVSALDGSSLAILRTHAVGSFPGELLLDRAGSRLFVSELGSGTVTSLDPKDLTPIERIALGGQPAGLAYDPPTDRLFVADLAGNSVRAISLSAPTPTPTPTPAPTATPTANLRPVIDSVAIAESAARTNDEVHAAVAAHDPENDTFTLEYQWTRNGIAIAGATQSTLDLSIAGNGDRDDLIAVRVAARDAGGTGDAVTSAPLAIENSPPTADVALDSEAPDTNATLTATVVVADADGDGVALTFSWSVNGAVRRTTVTSATTDTFDLRKCGNGDAGDLVSVTAVPNDGRGAGMGDTATATVTSALPIDPGVCDPT